MYLTGCRTMGCIVDGPGRERGPAELDGGAPPDEIALVAGI